jgi:hypothetical protein
VSADIRAAEAAAAPPPFLTKIRAKAGINELGREAREQMCKTGHDKTLIRLYLAAAAARLNPWLSIGSSAEDCSVNELIRGKIFRLLNDGVTAKAGIHSQQWVTLLACEN